MSKIPEWTFKKKMYRLSTDRCSMSLIVREMQIKISQLSEWLSSKRQQIARVDDDVKKREQLDTVGGNVNFCSHYEKQYEESKSVGHYWVTTTFRISTLSSNSTSGYFPKGKKITQILKRYVNSYVHCSLIDNNHS